MKENLCTIIGSGPAGYAAAIYAARAGLKPKLFAGASIGGQLTLTTDVENYPGYPDGVLGPDMMEDFRKQATRFGTEMLYKTVTQFRFGERGIGLKIDNSEELITHSLIIATGANAKWLGLESEKQYNGRGVSACAVCDGFFFKGEDVMVVGGGDTAAEEASYLSKICHKVYMLVRRDALRASIAMQERIKKTKNIEILWNHETKQILGDNKGVNAVLCYNNQSKQEREIPVKGFFVAIGHIPNTAIFKDWLDMDHEGYIITEPKSCKTNIPGVFACGDAQDRIYRQAVTAAGTGCMAALDAERYLATLE